MARRPPPTPQAIKNSKTFLHTNRDRLLSIEYKPDGTPLFRGLSIQRHIENVTGRTITCRETLRAAIKALSRELWGPDDIIKTYPYVQPLP